MSKLSQINASKPIRIILIFVSLAAFFIILISASHDPVDWSKLRLDPIWMVASVLFCIGHQFLASILWWKVLSVSGEPVRASTGIHAYLVSDLGKYIPGKIWSIAGRTAILLKEGVGCSTTITASVLEILLVTTSGILVGAIYFFHDTTGSGSIISDGQVITLFLVAASLLVAIYPTTQMLLLRLLGLVIKYPIPINSLSARTTFFLVILYSGLWIFSGLIHICIFTSISSETAPDLLIMSSVIALSTTLGFVTIFAPGGLGVREAVMASLLLPFVPVEIGAVFALVSRFIITVSQGLVTVLAASLYSYAGHRGGISPNATTIRAEDQR